MIVDVNSLELVVQNFKKRLELRVLDDEENPIVASELDLQIQQISGTVHRNDSFTSPPPGGTRIKNPATGIYTFLFGDPAAPENTPTNTESSKAPAKFVLVWNVAGPAGTEEEQPLQSVEIVPVCTFDRVRAFREQVDKARKETSIDPQDFFPLGYTDGQLLEYLRGGLTLINSYQPYPTFAKLQSFPDLFLQTLFDAGLVVAVNAQTLFAIDSDIEQYNDQGTSFVINHQPKLAAFSQAMTQRLDPLIKQMKLHFVNSGSVGIESGPNFRLQTLVQMSPSGATFRNVFTRS